MTDWQPIDTAPKDGTWILLTGGNIDYGWYWNDQPRVVSGFWYEESLYPSSCWQFAYYDGGAYGEYESPTHWQPLPNPPE